MSGNTYVMVVYASPPDRGGGTGKTVNLTVLPTQWRRPKEVPVAFQRRLARARCRVPDLEGLVHGS